MKSQAGQRRWSSIIPGARYRRTFAWLLHQLWGAFVGRIFVVAVLGLATVGTQIGGIWIVVHYVGLLGSDQEVRIGPFAFLPSQSIELLIAVAIAGSFLMVCSAAAMYVARLLIARVMIEFEAEMMRRIIASVARTIFSGAPLPDVVSDRIKFAQIINRGPRTSARAVGEMISLSTPLVAVLVIVPILFFIHPVLATGLLALLILSVSAYGRVGRHSATVSTNMDRSVIDENKFKGSTLAHLMNAGVSARDPLGLADRVVKEPAVIGRLQAFRRRLIMPHLATLLGGITLAIALAILVIATGLEMILARRNLPNMLVFSVLLIQLMQQVRHIGRSLTTVNMLYPWFHPMVAMILHDAKTEAKPSPEGLLQSSQSHETCRPGTLVGVIAPFERLDVFSMRSLSQTLNLPSATIVPDQHPLVLDDPWFSVGLEGRPTDEEIDRFGCLAPRIRRTVEVLDALPRTASSAAAWSSISQLDLLCVALIAVLRADVAAVFVPASMMVRLNTEEFADVLRAFEDQAVMVTVAKDQGQLHSLGLSKALQVIGRNVSEVETIKAGDGQLDREERGRVVFSARNEPDDFQDLEL